MKKLSAEFVATFFLVLCGTGAIVINNHSSGLITHSGIALCFGVIVTVMILAFGQHSGAHMNPAVTITMTALKKHPLRELPGYILAQTLGAVAASGLLKVLFPADMMLGATVPQGIPASSAFAMEAVLTFLLVMVILLTAFAGSENISRYAPFAIGLTVFLEAEFAGPVTGASMNPARSFAPALVSGNLQDLWIYLVATVLGALVAGFYWKWQWKAG